jgi:hypothetical protein
MPLHSSQPPRVGRRRAAPTHKMPITKPGGFAVGGAETEARGRPQCGQATASVDTSRWHSGHFVTEIAAPSQPSSISLTYRHAVSTIWFFLPADGTFDLGRHPGNLDPCTGDRPHTGPAGSTRGGRIPFAFF